MFQWVKNTLYFREDVLRGHPHSGDNSIIDQKVVSWDDIDLLTTFEKQFANFWRESRENIHQLFALFFSLLCKIPENVP